MSAPLPLDDQLCFSLYAASMAVNRVYKPLLDELGLTYPQYLAMHALWEGDGATVGAVAERLGLESSNATPLIKRLEKAGFVGRERSQKDERQVQVRVTQRGWALRDQCGCLTKSLLEKSGMTPEAIGALNRHVQRLRTALGPLRTPQS